MDRFHLVVTPTGAHLTYVQDHHVCSASASRHSLLGHASLCTPPPPLAHEESCLTRTHDFLPFLPLPLVREENHHRHKSTHRPCRPSPLAPPPLTHHCSATGRTQADAAQGLVVDGSASACSWPWGNDDTASLKFYRLVCGCRCVAAHRLLLLAFSPFFALQLRLGFSMLSVFPGVTSVRGRVIASSFFRMFAQAFFRNDVS